ncbi:MAG: threonine synthase [Caldilineaceae bacterium]|nr:threonine synthase [Caldilineaceae bacterium]MDE0183540.1 threonine synthase [Caldilineaceae bacterium]MDE0431236.1 threonine synthase [Caldilineaceae bacterium]
MIAYCPSSQFRIAAEEAPLRCPLSGEPLEYRELPPFDPDKIEDHNPGHWRYLPMLPVVAPGRELHSLGEGWTPLIEDTWLEQPIYWKFEGLMPSGSYKDRGVSVIINWLVGQGVRTVMDDSSGNAGASLACYAARAGLFARIFVPAYAPQPKKAQIAVYGAELVEVTGPRTAATEAAEASQTSDDVVYASHAWHPACLLGFMTNAWEIWEQLDRRVPDWFVTPVGYGGLFLGAWRGFQHLHRSGIIERLPRMVAVQAEPIAPICDAFHQGFSEIVPRRQVAPSVLADGIAVEKPVRNRSILGALRQSGGTAVVVNDEEINAAQERLAQRGLFVEPTSATVAAALTKLAPQFNRSDTVVVNLTGLGLKRLPAI